jgi:putative addiction module killer protein
MKVIPYTAWKLVRDNGRIPIDEFLESVRDKKARGRILSHIDRMERGLIGDWKEVGGIYELRLSFGPGYRIYYGVLETVHIVLAGGSDKSGQTNAIAEAKTLYADLLK